MSKSDPIATPDPTAPSPGTAPGALAPLRRDDFDRNVWCLQGIAVDAADINRAIAEIDDAVRSRRKLSFVTPNVNILLRAMKNQTARQEVLNADLSLADGAPLLLLAKILGVPLPSRVAGSDLFEALRRRPGFSNRRLKVFFFGGRAGAAQAAFEAINREKGGVDAVGWHNPGFGDVESMSSDEVIAKINGCDPDFVLVALGAGKGQSWIERNRDRLTAPVTAHLGAVVDFTGGGVARAPEWMQRSGLEWAWRIKEEPALWRRYFDDGLALAGLAFSAVAPQAGRGRAITGDVEVNMERASGQTVIQISGVASHNGLQPVREAFRAAADRGKQVCLDLSRLKAADRAFLGQVLMLEKNLSRAAAGISIQGASASLDALFRVNKMNYARTGAADQTAPGTVLVRKAAV